MSEVSGPYAPGTPCWVELSSPDQQASLDFYRDLFGWQAEVGAPETGGYAVCSLRGKPVAAIMATTGDPTPPPAWVTYLATSDAAATAQAVKTSGGRVLSEPMEVMSLGTMAVAADPDGAVFGIWQAADFAGAEIVNEPSAVAWNEVRADNLTTAGEFYTKVFGLTTETVPGDMPYLTLNVAGRPVGGAGERDASRGEPPNWLTYFCVDDTDSTVDAAVRAGGGLIMPSMDTPFGRIAVVSDPLGAVFALIQFADQPQS
jgi:predicted enzyme related to lactoylglutathione lyase